MPQRMPNGSGDKQAGTHVNTPDELRRAMAAVRHLGTPMLEPQPGDWVTTYRESGQTFDEYLAGNPVRADEKRHVIYVQPLGEFTNSQRRIVELTAEFMSAFFGLPVKFRNGLPLSLIPQTERRIHTRWGDEQLHTGYILANILRPTLPEDAVVLIALTAADLYPGPEMNFVFGQASLSDRVGVWSLYRLGNPDSGEDKFRLVLLRTLKIATHETGHMFSIAHCTKYECVMNGSNHLGETDRHPLEACPECVAKIWWATGTAPRERYQKLAVFCATQGLKTEQRVFEMAVKAIDDLAG